MHQPVEMFTPPLNITTEQIQKYLDENKQLIMAILENQNLGKSAECASYQTQLQQNLMYLAKIADAQPQAPKIPSQMPPQSSDQQEHYMQPSQAAVSHQQGFSVSKLPLSLNDQQQQQQQLPYIAQQQLVQDQIGMRSGASTSSGMHQAMQTGPKSSFMNLQGSKEGRLQAGAGDVLGKSASTCTSEDTEA